MADHRPDRAGADPDAGRQGRCRDHSAGSGRSLAQGAVSHRRHGQGRPRPSLLEYCAGRSVAPQRAEIRPVPTRSDEDQGGSHRHRRLIQPFRHQIQLLAAHPAPAEPDRYAAKLECLVRNGRVGRWPFVPNAFVSSPKPAASCVQLLLQLGHGRRVWRAHVRRFGDAARAARPAPPSGHRWACAPRTAGCTRRTPPACRARGRSCPARQGHRVPTVPIHAIAWRMSRSVTPEHEQMIIVIRRRCRRPPIARRLAAGPRCLR